MKNTLLRSLLLGAASLSPLLAIAGGVEVTTCCNLPRVDIPEMKEGWGISLEAAALRPYNNNLNYLAYETLTSEIVGATAFDFAMNNIEDIAPVYSLALRAGVDYTIADSANVIKLSYEHLFARDGSNEFHNDVAFDGGTVVYDISGTVKQKLDGVTLLSEQHILIGSSWETTLSGGARFAHVSQTFSTNENVLLVGTSMLAPAPMIAVVETSDFNMQYNGAGPLVGLGAIFHVMDNFALGAQTQGALLIGRNKISVDAEALILGAAPVGIAPPLTEIFTEELDSKSIYSIVPEMDYRLYANYFYRFTNGGELEVEAGWRANQFFNLRTFSTTGSADSIAINSVDSDDIGFSGPYLSFHYKI